MAEDTLSSLLTQRRKSLDALTIELNQQIEALGSQIEEAGKTAEKEIAARNKQVDKFIDDMRHKLEQELAKQFSQALLSQSGLFSGGSNLLGMSQNQWGGMLSSILSKAARNL